MASVKEWTTGDAHDVTDAASWCGASCGSTTACRRQAGTSATERHWVWQRGPWLLVDRVTGHITALKLPDYDPGVSQVSWFRDYGAYCGVTASGKSLYAVVAQVAARKPVLAKKLDGFDAENHPAASCASAEWQREPLRVTFHPAGKDAGASTSRRARLCWWRTGVTIRGDPRGQTVRRRHKLIPRPCSYCRKQIRLNRRESRLESTFFGNRQK